jgi:hypothetical protein
MQAAITYSTRYDSKGRVEKPTEVPLSGFESEAVVL